MTPRHANVPEHFSREQGYALADWERTLPGAVAPHPFERTAAGRVVVTLQGGGTLVIDWQELEPRRIALVRLPRLLVGFRFTGADTETRARFMRAFDLYTQRGGG